MLYAAHKTEFKSGTYFVDLAVEMYLLVVPPEDGPLRAETCRSDTVLIM
jgi:hypothetical protein